MLFPFLLAASCEKSDPDRPRRDVTFTNTTPKKMNVDIYGSLDDYNTNNNPVVKTQVPANGEAVVPGLEEGHAYLVDWYSDGYTYNNWWQPGTRNRSDMANILIPSSSKTSFKIEYNPIDSDASRIILLNGDQYSSHWIAVNAYNVNGKNIWDSLGANARYRELTVRKDFSVTYKTKNTSGNMVSETATYTIKTSRYYGGVACSIPRSDTAESISFFGQLYNKIPWDIYTSKDTIALAVTYKGSYSYNFLLARQH